MASAKAKKSVFFLRKLYQSLVPVDRATAEAMEGMAANEENYFELRKLSKEDVRSAAQNRLLWMWYTDASKTTVNEYSGWTKEDWHFEMKKRFLVPIFERDDEGYALMLVSLRKVYSQGLKAEAEALFKHIVKETSTTQASAQQFTEYLNEIHRFCGVNGIWLRTDQRLWDLAMNGNLND